MEPASNVSQEIFVYKNKSVEKSTLFYFVGDGDSAESGLAMEFIPPSPQNKNAQRR